MSEIKEIIRNSDLNDLNVGDRVSLYAAGTYSIYGLSELLERDKIGIYESYKGEIGEVTYVSKDYLVFDNYYILLSFYRELPF
jgi:hypothetical protein